jgi:hypothetical protein
MAMIKPMQPAMANISNRPLASNDASSRSEYTQHSIFQLSECYPAFSGQTGQKRPLGGEITRPKECRDLAKRAIGRYREGLNKEWNCLAMSNMSGLPERCVSRYVSL